MGNTEKKLPLVYLASPYTKGDRDLNLLAHFKMWRLLAETELMVPFAPLCNESMERFIDLTEDEAFLIDFAVLDRCDAVYAFNAVVQICEGSRIYFESSSVGRGREMARAQKAGTPVFFESEIDLTKQIVPVGPEFARLISWAIGWIKENN